MEKQIVVIAGPSGGGKNTIIQEIMRQCPNCTLLVTATTRLPRPGEVDGVDYYFFSERKFQLELAKGNILEHRYIEKLGTHYGVYKPDLEARLQKGHIVLAHLDIIGAKFLKEKYNATTIFILPLSHEELFERIRSRNPSMTPEELGERMRIAGEEITDHAPLYDYRVINATGKLLDSVNETMAILKKEGYNLGVV
ncbi:MAG: guanylate kinase [Parcubacteria group bacterium Gr01-1014_8]|nr:MAG: guanylate kinase [Parcubacteria group bacterium Gr01-1014_8]